MKAITTALVPLEHTVLYLAVSIEVTDSDDPTPPVLVWIHYRLGAQSTPSNPEHVMCTEIQIRSPWLPTGSLAPSNLGEHAE